MISLPILRTGLLAAAVLGFLFLTGCKTVEPDPIDDDSTPETLILDGETDWAHPGDPESYPYYIQLNDPAQIHHPFSSGDRIPDRTYVVIKALARNEQIDKAQDGDIEIGINGFLQGVRRNFNGGTYSFSSEASDLNMAPTWDSLCDTCWSADTLGFLTGPSTEFTINMHGVNIHGVRDATPATLSFDVGHPPCLQCIELLPWTSLDSELDPSIPCVDDPASNACLTGTTELRVRLGAVVFI